MFKDDITGRPLVVSNKSTQTIVMALVAAHRAGVISDYEYSMTYAEVCALGYMPQAFGGKPVDKADLTKWQSLKSWVSTQPLGTP
jgi:hypothetical protein